eukprot:TRINITY_DN2590_c0_g2_i2.p1 TRINITY_DN2590_c0_g2~~TRINITY_DN2590_c0_g2_i2.p1  ORF type:complete len:124 (+),score=15.33 TRINITY_DN2590_c0_g2_i2:288-659(+)
MKTEYGSTSLHLASLQGQMKCARLLLDHKANVNSVTKAGWTPLFSACRSGNGDLAWYLLSSGGTLGDKNIEEWWSAEIKKLLVGIHEMFNGYDVILWAVEVLGVVECRDQEITGGYSRDVQRL